MHYLTLLTQTVQIIANMASVATYKKTLVPFLERVFFFSHSLRLAGIHRLDIARSTRQLLREILTPVPSCQRPRPHMVKHASGLILRRTRTRDRLFAWGFR